MNQDHDIRQGRLKYISDGLVFETKIYTYSKNKLTKRQIMPDG